MRTWLVDRLDDLQVQLAGWCPDRPYDALGRFICWVAGEHAFYWDIPDLGCVRCGAAS